MRTIYKYPFPLEDKFDIVMKRGAVPLSVQMQNGVPHIWCMVESGQEDEVRHFRVYGTGHQLPNDPVIYYGTIQVSSGMFVWHLFEVQEKPPTPLHVA